MTPRTPSSRPSPRAARGFYRSALTAAEREDFDEARELEGLDEEVALLRLRLRDALVDHPEDVELLHHGVRLLVQALVAQRRLSPQQAEGLGEAAANLLAEFGEVLRTSEEAAGG